MSFNIMNEVVGGGKNMSSSNVNDAVGLMQKVLMENVGWAGKINSSVTPPIIEGNRSPKDKLIDFIDRSSDERVLKTITDSSGILARNAFKRVLDVIYDDEARSASSDKEAGDWAYFISFMYMMAVNNPKEIIDKLYYKNHIGKDNDKFAFPIDGTMVDLMHKEKNKPYSQLSDSGKQTLLEKRWKHMKTLRHFIDGGDFMLGTNMVTSTKLLIAVIIVLVIVLLFWNKIKQVLKNLGANELLEVPKNIINAIDLKL